MIKDFSVTLCNDSVFNNCNLVPRDFPSKKWVGREKALASAGHVNNLNIPEKLIYMQPTDFSLTEVERSNNGK